MLLDRDRLLKRRKLGGHGLIFRADLRHLELRNPAARQPRFDALAAGEVITTGTLTAALPIAPGETWTSEYGGLPVNGLRLILTA